MTGVILPHVKFLLAESIRGIKKESGWNILKSAWDPSGNLRSGAGTIRRRFFLRGWTQTMVYEPARLGGYI
jgi:hypothetical protein